MYREIGDLDLSTGAFKSGQWYERGQAPNNAQRQFDLFDIAVSTRRPNRGAVAVITDKGANDFYSVFLARLKPNDPNLSFWLKEFLRQEEGRKLLEQRCTWTTYPVISEDDLETIPIPLLPQDWYDIRQLSKMAHDNEMFSELLIASAKHFVEALIEDSVSEAELVASQETLQQGNRELDRAILARMTSHGIDVVDAPRLFPDIDALYGALDGLGKEPQENEVGHA